MHARLVIALALAAAAMGPAHAQAAGMFCHPGQSWTTVDAGTTTGEGWSVVNFTKPEGGQMRLLWHFEDFDDGPTSGGVLFGPEPMSPVAGAIFYQAEAGTQAKFDVRQPGPRANESVETDASAWNTAGNRVFELRVLAHVDANLTTFQYAAGEDEDGRQLTWTLQIDNCLDGTEIQTATEQGDGAHLVGPDDLTGPVNAHARTNTPGIVPGGAVALLEANASAAVEETPFVDAYWAKHSGDMHMEGPDGIELDDLYCTETDYATSCTGWGSYISPFSEHFPEGLTAGVYEFSATGFTDPARYPLGSSVGPYFTLVETRFPSLKEASP